jgi:hypothetical protein
LGEVVRRLASLIEMSARFAADVPDDVLALSLMPDSRSA